MDSHHEPPFFARLHAKNRNRLFHFLKTGNHGVAWAINGAVLVHGEDQRAGQHRPEIAARDDLVTVNFVGTVNGIRAECHIGLAVFEFSVDCAAGVPVFTLGAAPAPRGPCCRSQNEDEKRIADGSAIHKILLSTYSTFLDFKIARGSLSLESRRPATQTPSVAVWLRTVLQFRA